MIAPLILRLCDKIVELLNTGSQNGDYEMRFAAVRYFQPKFTLPELEEGLKVCVVPAEVERSNLTRSVNQQNSTIQIGVLSRVESTLAGIDPYVALVDSMALILDGAQLDNVSSVVEARIAPIFDQQLLRDNKQFTSIISITVRSFL
jgi:hypothetical protein